MNELLSRMDPAFLIPLAAIFMAFLTAIVMAISKSWSRVRQTEIEAALKQDMLNRGMTAADIRQVLQASTRKDSCGGFSTNPTEEQVEIQRLEIQAKLKKDMLDRGLSPDQIERLLKAGV